MERAGGAVDLVVEEVLLVIPVGDRDLEGEEGVVGAHSRVRVGGIAGVAVGDTDVLWVGGVAVLEDHRSSQGQRVVGVEPGADVVNDLVEHAPEDGGTSLSGEDFHLLLRASLGEVMSDRGDGAGIVELPERDKRQDVGVEVDTTLGVKGTKSEEIGAVRGRCQARVGIGDNVAAVFADEGLGRDVAEVAELVIGVDGLQALLGEGDIVISGDGVHGLGDLGGLAGLLFRKRKLEEVLAQLAVGGVVNKHSVDARAGVFILLVGVG
mmetsp:Transcript_20045/g.46985  ORF Transcript_20045/g.46985 Transcript_20045/m.46985 type:complete len:266 (+) Transcript_20045:428-1225(+)